MTLDFTWIKFAGEDCILITDRDQQRPILYLMGYQIRQLKRIIEEKEGGGK